MTEQQLIALAFVVMIWTIFAGSSQLRQHMGNLSIACFVGTCTAVAVDNGFESWAPTEHSFLISLVAFAAMVCLFMWLAIRGDWNAPSEIDDAVARRQRKTSE